MYAAAFSEWARIGRPPRSLKCNRVRRSVDSTKKTWLIPVPAKARANHSAPFIAAVSLMLCPPHTNDNHSVLLVPRRTRSGADAPWQGCYNAMWHHMTASLYEGLIRCWRAYARLHHSIKREGEC